MSCARSLITHFILSAFLRASALKRWPHWFWPLSSSGPLSSERESNSGHSGRLSKSRHSGRLSKSRHSRRLSKSGHSGRLSNSGPCSPSTKEMREHNVTGKTAISPSKYFVLSTGVFNFSDVTKCFYEQLNARENELDESLWVLDAEHSTDVPFINMLQDHPLRTTFPEEAGVFFVGTAFHTATIARDYDLKCIEARDLADRKAALAQVLAGMPMWQSNSDKFVFINTDFRIGDQLGAVDRLLRYSHGILATSDDEIAKKGMGRNKSLPMPYRTHHLLESRAGKGTTSRRWNFFFHGHMNRTGEGTARYIVANLSRGLTRTNIVDANIADKSTAVLSISAAARVTAASAQQMLHSKFCFVPAGDTPSSRRLFDALAAGCIPVIFEDFATIARNLPFRNTIDWSKIAIFAGSANCTADKFDETQEWLQGLAGDESEMTMQVEAMRSRGQKMYARYLSYNSTEMVTAVLNELRVDDEGHVQLQGR